jgi:hypothetical protein
MAVLHHHRRDHLQITQFNQQQQASPPIAGKRQINHKQSHGSNPIALCTHHPIITAPWLLQITIIVSPCSIAVVPHPTTRASSSTVDVSIRRKSQLCPAQLYRELRPFLTEHPPLKRSPPPHRSCTIPGPRFCLPCTHQAHCCKLRPPLASP